MEAHSPAMRRNRAWLHRSPTSTAASSTYRSRTVRRNLPPAPPTTNTGRHVASITPASFTPHLHLIYTSLQHGSACRECHPRHPPRANALPNRPPEGCGTETRPSRTALYTSFTPHLHLIYTWWGCGGATRGSCERGATYTSFTPHLHLIYTSFTPGLCRSGSYPADQTRPHHSHLTYT